jgi:single-strand DNA-binding protein
MNKCEIVGRLTNDPETRTGQNDSTVTRFSVAVNRRFKNAEGNYDADFIRCVAFGRTAEFVDKYFKKGSAIGIVGRITTGNYTNKDGVKVYTTEVTAEEVEFVESKNASGNGQAATSANAANDDFMNIPDGIDETLPFN